MFNNNICRICGQNSIFKFPLNEKITNDGLKVIELYNETTQLCAKLNDELPQQICSMCSSELQLFYEFLIKAKQSDKKLRQLKPLPNSNATTSMWVDDTESVLLNSEFEFSVDPLENINDNAEIILAEPLLNMHSKNVAEVAENDEIANREFTPPSDPNNVETLIFPMGRYKCSICGKRYFTIKGHKVHMDVHLQNSPTNKKNKCQGSQGKNQRKETHVITKKDKIQRVLRKTKTSQAKQPKIDEAEIPCNQNQNEHLVVSQLNLNKTKPKKIYPCKICGKLMISASKLRYHMVMHTGEKDYLCTICPKAYSTIYALKYHMHTHTGERPYECKFCGDKFLRPTTLKSHVRRHTDERPYGCNICGKRFIQHSSMTTHIKLNHMAKTIPCPHCDKKYARKTDLSTHLLSHTGDKPFSCTLCASRFIRQANLNKHMNQHHHHTISKTVTEKNFKTKQLLIQTANINPNDQSPVKMISC